MSHEQEEWVKRRAYAIWQSEGCPDGRDGEHWERAEREFLADRATGQKVECSDHAAEPIVAANATRARRATRKTVTPGASRKKKSAELRP